MMFEFVATLEVLLPAQQHVASISEDDSQYDPSQSVLRIEHFSCQVYLWDLGFGADLFIAEYGEVLVCGWSKPHLWPRHLETSQLFLTAPESQPELLWGCWEHLNVWPVWKIFCWGPEDMTVIGHIDFQWMLWTFVTAEESSTFDAYHLSIWGLWGWPLNIRLIKVDVIGLLITSFGCHFAHSSWHDLNESEKAASNLLNNEVLNEGAFPNHHLLSSKPLTQNDPISHWICAKVSKLDLWNYFSKHL